MIQNFRHKLIDNFVKEIHAEDSKFKSILCEIQIFHYEMSYAMNTKDTAI